MEAGWECRPTPVKENRGEDDHLGLGRPQQINVAKASSTLLGPD